MSGVHERPGHKAEHGEYGHGADADIRLIDPVCGMSVVRASRRAGRSSSKVASSISAASTVATSSRPTRQST